jgi:hypothetical protein
MLTLSGLGLFAQTDTETKFIIDIPGVDLPANIDHGGLAFKQFSPSMQQSLALSKSIAEAQQYYTKRLFFNPQKGYTLGGKVIRVVGLSAVNAGIELLIGGTPFGTGWTHEEWHRAVMNKNNVRSFNDMNKFPIGKETVSVSKEKDEDLARFKADNNPDFVRMNVAGIEAQYEYVKALQKDNFYNKLNLFSQVSYLLNVFNSVEYVKVCSTIEGDVMTKELEEEEGTDIAKRDFTGLDMTAWIYDLSRPDIPYSDRGLHPSGVGIRRYRVTTDLNTEELDYLKKMGKLQYLNFVSPQMVFINSIRLNDDTRFNFSLFHYLTSFGYDLGGNVFLEYQNQKIFFAIHNYHNLNHSFYGLEAQLLDKELEIYRRKLTITPSFHVWTQPKDQEFRTSKSQLGAKVSLNVSALLDEVWRPYIDLSAKSAGWVAGDPYLSSNFNFRIGIRAFVN